MDLRFMEAAPTAREAALIEAAVPAAEVDEGRTVRSGQAARSSRHLLLPVLDAVQSEFGWVSGGAANAVARRLAIPPAEVYAVASFYALISTEERPARVAHICDDAACRMAGGARLFAALSDRDDVVESPCLGQCDHRPAVFVQRAGEADIVIPGADLEQVTAALDDGWEPGPSPAGPSTPQTAGRRVLAGVGVVDPTSLDSYRAAGGYRGLATAVERGPEAVIAALETSGLKGRGGAAFPTGVKWRAVHAAQSDQKYVICNADESEPGTFKDRVLIEGDPFAIIETMTIAGYTVGATRGYIYLRGEYPRAARLLADAITQARAAGLLGTDVLGAGFAFDIDLRRGQGAYICGEETALMNSIEGFRGEPRQKPPFPTQAGLFGQPTLINNVETLVNLFDVLEDPVAFAARGTPESTGTRLFCLSGDVEVPGVYEAELGTTLGAVIEMAGGPIFDIQAVLLGGAAGSFVGPGMLDLPLTFEHTRDAGLSLGSGVVMVFDSTRDMTDVVRRIARFFRDESCGQCVPCRVGTQRVEEAVARGAAAEADLIDELDRAMRDASICGLGHTAASAVKSAIRLGIV
jgi:NADH-quinone oxidoreductase subunit F